MILVKRFIIGITFTVLAVLAVPIIFDVEGVMAQDAPVPIVTSEEAATETVPVEEVLNQPTANIQKSLCAGVNLDVNTNCSNGISGQDATDEINKLISDVINFLSLIVGVVAVIMIIVGGFRYIISGGDSNNVSSAKNTILYAIIGLIIVALSQTIVKFVLGRVIVS